LEWTPVAISIGAIAGALGRYFITLLWIRYRGIAFPYGTLCVNLMGSFLIGFWLTWSRQHGIVSPFVQQLILVGFLGSYTTFSSYILDTHNLFKADRGKLAMLYWWGSPLAGLLAFNLGTGLAQVATQGG
jgi:CrcB protein